MMRDEVLGILRRDNPAAGSDLVVMYADCFLDYREAAENIAKNGNIVAHPRTGAPIENPYIKVKSAAMGQLLKLTRLRKVGALWD